MARAKPAVRPICRYRRNLPCRRPAPHTPAKCQLETRSSTSIPTVTCKPRSVSCVSPLQGWGCAYLPVQQFSISAAASVLPCAPCLRRATTPMASTCLNIGTVISTSTGSRRQAPCRSHRSAEAGRSGQLSAAVRGWHVRLLFQRPGLRTYLRLQDDDVGDRPRPETKRALAPQLSRTQQLHGRARQPPLSLALLQPFLSHALCLDFGDPRQRTGLAFARQEQHRDHAFQQLSDKGEAPQDRSLGRR